MSLPDSLTDLDEPHPLRIDRLCWMSLGLLTLALATASIYRVGWLALYYTNRQPNLGNFLGWEPLDLWLRTVSTWPKFFAAVGLLRISNDVGWRRRAALYLFCTIVDVGLWTLENGTMIGLFEFDNRDQEWLRYGIGTAVGWSEFLLLIGMVTDIAVAYGDDHAPELARTIRSLTMIGMSFWFFFFLSVTRFGPGPIGIRRLTVETFLLWQGVRLIWTLCLIQTTILVIRANRSCGEGLKRAMRERKVAEAWPFDR